MQTATNYHYQQARYAIEQAGLRFLIGELWGDKIVSAPSSRQVWLSAEIRLDDERIVLRWKTAQGIAVADEVRVAINDNAPAIIAALASAEVNA